MASGLVGTSSCLRRHYSGFTGDGAAIADFNSLIRRVWWLRLGIEIERIKPGNPQQNGRHERMHLPLKLEATKPAAKNFLQQQASSMTSSTATTTSGHTKRSTCNVQPSAMFPQGASIRVCRILIIPSTTGPSP
jgi:putative transposase